MRRTWIVTICLMFATAEAATKPTAVRLPAAEKQEEQAEDQDGAENDPEAEQSEVSERPVRPSTSPSPKTASPNEVHSVVRGDTLWDLSQRYLGSPWYWPKVWSYNPEIANPHWIYPGNRVRFFSAGEEVPSEVEVASEPTARSGEDNGQVRSPDSIDNDHEPDVRVSGKIGYRPKRGIRVTHQGFLTANQLDQSGVIDSSFAETLMFSYPDHVYVKFPRTTAVKVGERYLIFRTAAEIIHPITRRKVGYLTHILGTVRVTKLSNELATAQVNPDTWDAVHRGDRIGPAGEQLNDVIERRPNDRELNGYVIGVLIPYLTALGEHNVIIIDKGRSDGVQTGQTFTVVRQQDPISPEAFLNPARERDPRLPPEDVGTCMAIEVKDVATMCLLTRSLREIVHGDRVEMRPDAAKEPRAALR
jgi:hypothetical protein